MYVELQLFLSRRTLTVLVAANSNCSCSGELQLFLLRRTPTVLVTANSNSSCCGELQLFLLRRTPTVLVTANSTFFLLHRTQVFYSTLQRVYSTPSAGPSILHTYFVKSPVSGPFINAYSVKSSVILYSALGSRTSLYPVSRVYTNLSTLDSALLCNSERPLRILIL